MKEPIPQSDIEMMCTGIREARPIKPSRLQRFFWWLDNALLMHVWARTWRRQ
jgi:hypothetical protein